MKETEGIREREFRTTSYRTEKEKRERERESILGVSQVNRNVISYVNGTRGMEFFRFRKNGILINKCEFDQRGRGLFHVEE